MFQLIDSIITDFRSCFNRERAWKWFACLVIAFMIRGDHRGVTAVVSALRIKPCLYNTILHFFRSKAYTVKYIYEKWVEIVQRRAPLLEVSNRVVLIGDHIKISKEGRRMPCIQKHHQESQNSGKAEYIEGHNYGQISALLTNGETCRSIPLMAEIQESKAKTGGESLVEQMILLAVKAAKGIQKPVIVVLDAYFCSGMAWKTADTYKNHDGSRRVEIVTRAKSNTVAYTEPVSSETPKLGRPRLYGDKIKLASLFSSGRQSFAEKDIVLYGKKVKARYLCRDLVWKPVGKIVRFVLVEIDKKSCIFMSSDLTLSPEEIITLYGKRFKIETGFDVLKNDMGRSDIVSGQSRFRREHEDVT